jgi:hypothetical protein
LVEKSLTYRWECDYKRIKKEKDKGGDVSFKWWERGGLDDVGLTYFGSYLIGKMFTLDFEKCHDTNLHLEDQQDEIDNEIVFPMVDVDKLELKNGYSSEERENHYLSVIMYEEIINLLVKDENKKAVSELEVVNKCEDDETHYLC